MPRPFPLAILFAALGFLWTARGSTVANYTIDDTDPRVNSTNANPVPCPASGIGQCLLPGGPATDFDYSVLIQGTLTFILGTVTVPFTGQAVYVYFANAQPMNFSLLLDNAVVGQYVGVSGCQGQVGDPCPFSRSILGYQNTSLQEIHHVLTIVTNTPPIPMAFDGIIHSSNGTGSSMPSNTPSGVPTVPTSTPIAPIAGGAAAGVVLIAALSLCIWRKRRAARPLHLTPTPFGAKEEKSMPEPAPPELERPESRLASSRLLERIEARIQRLEHNVLPVPPRDGNESPPPPTYHSGALSISDEGREK
ncbi:hypothetical protein B0H11DRAFT_2224460 [Mycena galericulata]|nr:hypothetical protein B0H11DRAFT_2224460 [Mycena galericulata]